MESGGDYPGEEDAGLLLPADGTDVSSGLCRKLNVLRQVQLERSRRFIVPDKRQSDCGRKVEPFRRSRPLTFQ